MYGSMDWSISREWEIKDIKMLILVPLAVVVGGADKVKDELKILNNNVTVSVVKQNHSFLGSDQHDFSTNMVLYTYHLL